MASADIRLKRVSKIYNEGNTVAGVVIIDSRGEFSHNGILLTMEGIVNLQLSAKSVGMFEAFYNSIKPITLISYGLELAKPGKLPSGKTEIPFEMPLKSKSGKQLYETYHGVFVNIQYMLRVDIKRSLLNKDLQKEVEFIVEYREDQEERSKPKQVTFNINPSALQNVRERQVPNFEIRGHLDSTCCSITQSFTGELRVIKSDMQIKSIEIQLIRVETCGCAEGYAKEATEIQNIQIADGDVCRDLPIPIFMIFPRLFTCPSLATSNFKVEFEVNIVIVFANDYLVTENFPIRLTRS